MKTNIIDWIINKKSYEKELKKMENTLKDKMIISNELKTEIKELKEKLEFIKTRDEEKTETIKNLRKQIRQLKKELKGDN